MKERIMREPEVVEEGFRALESERESEDGRIDVFGRDSEGNAVETTTDPSGHSDYTCP